ncbi:hypothetical protein H8356DRAFT_1268355 [Neocallimastix lanati (nom. inval.)]|nr:hypothetical protein H8356DRAFT_1268355 [Neocallimastix sp. JGI-2020a]
MTIEKVNEIEIINLSITGNVYFNNSKKITINNVSIKGYINSNFDKINNENVKISNFIYNTSNYSSNVCVNLGGNVEIENSKFYGSSSCQERLFDFNGLDKYKLSIKNSYFSGEYGCPCLQVNNSTNSYIEDSIIEKAFSPYGSTGGAGIRMAYSHGKISNTTFKDIISYPNGGAFSLFNNYELFADHLNIYNTTSLYMVF